MSRHAGPAPCWHAPLRPRTWRRYRASATGYPTKAGSAAIEAACRVEPRAPRRFLPRPVSFRTAYDTSCPADHRQMPGDCPRVFTGQAAVAGITTSRRPSQSASHRLNTANGPEPNGPRGLEKNRRESVPEGWRRRQGLSRPARPRPRREHGGGQPFQTASRRAKRSRGSNRWWLENVNAS